MSRLVMLGGRAEPGGASSRRRWELARAIAAAGLPIDVVTDGPEAPDTEEDVRRLDTGSGEARRAIETAEAFVADASMTPDQLARLPDRPLAVDLDRPSVFELLETPGRAGSVDSARARTTAVIERADLIVCSNERQRDLWVGAALACGRISPTVHHARPQLDALVRVVPSGLPERVPHPRRAVLKGVHPGIAPDDVLLLWGGSVQDWHDTDTLLAAMARLRDRRPHVKLIFLGTAERPGVSPHPELLRTRARAQSLGVAGGTVFFGTWPHPPRERADWLLGADLGVVCHPLHLETRYASRARVLDYLWCGLPVLTTVGDAMAERVVRLELGATVAPGDVDGWVRSIERATDPEWRYDVRARIARVRPRWSWSRVAEPLVEWCRAPWRTRLGSGVGPVPVGVTS